MVVENCAVCRPIVVGLEIFFVYICWRRYCSDIIHSYFNMSLEMMTPETGNTEMMIWHGYRQFCNQFISTMNS